MRVDRLTRAGQDRAREETDTLQLRERFGVVGDHKSEKDGSVSLLSGEAEAKIRKSGGICAAKFAANIVTQGLDYALFAQGTRIKIADAELQITRVGKPCYEACEMLQSGESCPLPTNCAFAQVTRGGRIYKSDEIRLSNASNDTHQL